MAGGHPAAAPPTPFDQAVALLQADRLEEAAALCQAVLQAHPRAPAPLHLLGSIRYRQQRFDEAAFLLTALLGVQPDHPGGLNDLACTALEQGRAEQAVPLLDRLLQAAPDHFDARFNRGNAHLALGALEAAAEDYAHAHALQPGEPRTLNNLATVRRLQGRADEALVLITQALAIQPEMAMLQANLGTILQALGRDEPARAAFRLSLEYGPSNADVWNNLATSLFDAGKHDEALDCLHEALALRPDFAVGLFNLGNALVKLNRPQEAVEAYHRVLALRPDYAEAMHNLGGAHMMCRDPDAAIGAFRRALDQVRAAPDGGAGTRDDGDRDDDRITFSLSLALLTKGDYPAGLEAYESRLRLRAVAPLQPRHTIRPRWDGTQDPDGLTVLLHAEQGYGDNVQFCRYAPLVAARGARVVIEAPAPLLPVLRSLPYVDRFVMTGEELPPFDCYCPMASLPLAFATTPDSVPAATPYLHEAPDRVARWRPEVSWDGRRRVGIAWSGNPAFTNDAARTMALSLLAPLRAAGVTLHVLQRDVRPADRALLAEWDDVRDLSAGIVDFADTAALISLMDLVVSVDTSIAHLAGALGVPVWVLLPYAADWRWLRDRDDSIWYPTARLFRQDAPGQWAGVVDRVVAAIGGGW